MAQKLAYVTGGMGGIGTAMLELGAGIMLLVGWRARRATAALFVFTALAALFFPQLLGHACGASRQPDDPLHEERLDPGRSALHRHPWQRARGAQA